MAINRTPDKYKGFTFDGVDSKDFGVYISDTGAFNAPERDVEMIEIPGRNGAYALDKGRFNNIEVTYNAFVATDSESDYISGINALRNALCSRKGYCRLEDEFNPNEYRMAVYKSGLKVSSISDQSGEFTITFDCKPQRFLKSGETAVSVASGGTITNPTLFDASPILEVYGYGNITIGESGSVQIAKDVLVGDVVLSNGVTRSISSQVYNEITTWKAGYLETGDIITAAPTTISALFVVDSDIQSIQIIKSGYNVDATTTKLNNRTVKVLITWSEETFTVGTSRDLSSSVTVIVAKSGGSVNVVFDTTFAYYADSRLIQRRFVPMETTIGTTSKNNEYAITGAITAYSTAPAYTEPLYFDLGIGEAYAIEDGEPVSINGAVSFGADLPVLVSGTSTITLSNTIEELRIIPRWWEV